MSKIVLSYAKSHFNPEIDLVSDGVGELSRSLWKALKKNFPHDEIIYADYNDYRDYQNVKDVRLFIGVSPNFNKFVRTLKPQKAILWSVNASAFQRRKIISEAKNRGFPRKALTSEDGIFSNLFETFFADLVIVLGGWDNYKSYTRTGMPDKNVFAIGNGYSGQSELQELSCGKDILFFAGNLTFRKGIHLIDALATLLRRKDGIKLKIVGRTKNVYWRNKLEFLIEKYSEQIEYYPKFYDLNSSEWSNLMAECKFAIFPSFEEGVSAAAAEVISAGLPLLYSVHAGFEITKSMPILTMDSDELWINQVENLLAQSNEFLAELLEDQQTLLLMGSESISHQVERLIERLATQNSIWPNIEVKSENSQNVDFRTISAEFFEYEVNIMENGIQDRSKTFVEVFSPDNIEMSELTKIGVLLMDRYLPINQLLIWHSDNHSKTISISRKNSNKNGFTLNRVPNNGPLHLKIFVSTKQAKFLKQPLSSLYLSEFFRKKYFYRILNRLN